MKPLLKIDDPAALTTGLFPALPKNQLALWQDGANVLFHNARVEKLCGVETQGQVLGGQIITALTQASVEGQARVYYGTASALYKWVLGVQTQIGSGYSSSNWILEPYGDWLLATNNTEPVQLWKGTGVAADLETQDQFTRARIIRKLANHVIAFGTNDLKQGAHWSAKGNPELWNPLNDDNQPTSAGFLPFRDLSSDIVAVEPLGEALGVYTTSQFGIFQYVGSPLWFGFRKVLDGIGAHSRWAVVNVANQHFGWGPSGIWRNNGVNFSYIHTPAVKQWLDENVDPAAVSQIRAFHYQNKELVVFSFINTVGDYAQVGYCYGNNSWMLGDLQLTAVAEQGVFDYPLVAIDGYWGFLNSPGAGDFSIGSSLTTTALDAGDSDVWKLWNYLLTETEGDAYFEVRFGFSDAPDAEIEWTDWHVLAREVWIDRESLHLTIEFRSTVAVGAPDLWGAITGIEVFGSRTGARR